MSDRSRDRPDLSVDIAGLHLRNPTIVASGVLGFSLKILRRAVRLGAGGVISPSIGIRSSEGFRAPTVVKVDCGYVTAMGLPNPGASNFAAELGKLSSDFPLIINIFASETNEFQRIVSVMEATPAKAYELNFSSPELDSESKDVAKRIESISEVVRVVRAKTKRPVIVKVSPETEARKIAVAAHDNGADAISAINSVPAMAIDIETGYPILSNKAGGLSGRAIKPIALKYVYEISKNVDVPVIGCGGITTWQDAVEFFYAGASAIQIGSSVGERGLRVFGNVVDGIRSYLVKKKRASIREIVGFAHRR